jgi:choline dehydrogenase-like flavoprotein
MDVRKELPGGRSMAGKARTGRVVALAANGIFNPAILLASGIDHGPVGEDIHEQVGIRIVADLAVLSGLGGRQHAHHGLWLHVL